MSMFLRTLYLFFIRALFPYKKQTLFEPCQTHFIVWPLDLDINMHLTNGRYLSLMDIARFDLLIKSGEMYKSLKKGFLPVVITESIRFKRSLQPFQKFYIETEMEALTDKDFYLKQSFISNGKVCAVAMIKGRFLKRGKSIATDDFFKAMNIQHPGLQASPLANKQQALEDEYNKLIFPKSSNNK